MNVHLLERHHISVPAGTWTDSCCTREVWQGAAGNLRPYAIYVLFCRARCTPEKCGIQGETPKIPYEARGANFSGPHNSNRGRSSVQT